MGIELTDVKLVFDLLQTLIIGVISVMLWVWKKSDKTSEAIDALSKRLHEAIGDHADRIQALETRQMTFPDHEDWASLREIIASIKTRQEDGLQQMAYRLDRIENFLLKQG